MSRCFVCGQADHHVQRAANTNERALAACLAGDTATIRTVQLECPPRAIGVDASPSPSSNSR